MSYENRYDTCLHCRRNVPRRWSELSYAGEQRVPPGDTPSAGSWPTYYLQRDNGKFLDPGGKPVAWQIRTPGTFDFTEQLQAVKDTLDALTQTQICIAEYWNAGPPTKQWTPIIDILIDTYGIAAVRAARVLSAVQAGINDALVVAWYFKFLWDVARPNQLDQELATITCTPRHPSYPSGHATVAGCAEVILSYFFVPEAKRLRELAEECARSRLYAGVHFPADNDEGLRLGRQVGEIVVAQLSDQYDRDQAQIDYPITENRHAQIPPPPYRQVIEFPRERECSSLLSPRECPDAR